MWFTMDSSNISPLPSHSSSVLSFPPPHFFSFLPLYHLYPTIPLSRSPPHHGPFFFPGLFGYSRLCNYIWRFEARNDKWEWISPFVFPGLGYLVQKKVHPFTSRFYISYSWTEICCISAPYLHCPLISWSCFHFWAIVKRAAMIWLRNYLWSRMSSPLGISQEVLELAPMVNLLLAFWKYSTLPYSFETRSFTKLGARLVAGEL